MPINYTVTMEDDTDLQDPIFKDMDMTDSGEIRNFLEVCRKSHGCSRGNTDFNDWKVFVSLLVQMRLVDLNRSDDFYDEVQEITRNQGGTVPPATARVLVHPPAAPKC